MEELLFGRRGRFSNWREGRKWADGRTGNRLGGEDRTRGNLEGREMSNCLRFSSGGQNEGRWRGMVEELQRRCSREQREWWMEAERMVARRSRGGGGLRRRLEDGSVAMTAEKNRGRGKEWRRSSRRHGGVRRRRRLDSFPGLP